MKIDYALMSCDSNPLYLDFWPLVSKLWKLKFGITPILIYVGDDDVSLSTEYGEVVRVPFIKDISTPTQSLLARYWYVSKKPESVCIISDIDMLPLSTKYFCDIPESFDDDVWLHLNDCFGASYSYIPTCYHVAKGSLFNKVWKIEESWEDFVRNVVANYKDEWFCDEAWATAKIQKYDDKSIFKFLKRDLGQNGHRIDRPNFVFDINLLKNGYYYDAHCPRPYLQHKQVIDTIVNVVLSTIGEDVG